MIRIMIVAALLAPVLAQPSPAADAGTVEPLLCAAPYLVEGAGWSLCWQKDDERVQGLEINDVRFEGKRVLWKAGVPFSITRYNGYKAGPFKDTLGSSSSSAPGFGNGSLPIAPSACPRFLAEGVLLADGKVCVERSDDSPVPAIALWSRWDIVNYRFANAWILRGDGSIEPRILLGGLLLDQAQTGGPGGTASRGAVHAHHTYFRFDFDVDGRGNDTIEEYARTELAPATEAPAVNHPAVPKPEPLDVCHNGGGALPQTTNRAVGGGIWCPVAAESPRVRDYALGTRWRVVDVESRNAHGTPRSYEVLSGSLVPGDGPSSADAWALAWKGDSAEIGYEVPAFPAVDAPLALYAAPSEPAFRTDVVLWVVDHVLHEPRDEENPSMMYHASGPVLKPRNFLDGNALEQTFP